VTGKLPQPPLLTPHQISVSPTHIEFGWVSSSDIGGASKLEAYNVYVDGTLVTENGLPASSLEYRYEGATAGQSYKVSITSVTLIGEGPKSNPLTIWAVDVPSATTLLVTDTTRDTCSV
jgi:hypothetical protein